MSQIRYPFRSLTPGDSFVTNQTGIIRSYQFGRQHNLKFTTRRQSNNQIRIWLVDGVPPPPPPNYHPTIQVERGIPIPPMNRGAPGKPRAPYKPHKPRTKPNKPEYDFSTMQVGDVRECASPAYATPILRRHMRESPDEPLFRYFRHNGKLIVRRIS